MKLEKQAEKGLKKQLKELITRIKACKSLFDIEQSWTTRELLTNLRLEQLKNGKLSIKEAKEIMLKKAMKNYEKELAKRLQHIEAIKKAEPIKWGTCDIEWSRGGNPSGEYRNGFNYGNYGGIGGYGYDKLSTLTANMFNSDLHLLHVVAEYIEKHNINKDNIRERLGYGVYIFNGKIYFDGGVGFSCHRNILEKLGYKVEWHETRHADFIHFEKK